MSLSQPIRQSLVLVLSLLLLGACQRASYSFQREGSSPLHQPPLPAGVAFSWPATAPALDLPSAASPPSPSPLPRRTPSARVTGHTRPRGEGGWPLVARPQPATQLGWLRKRVVVTQPADAKPEQSYSRTLAIALVLVSILAFPFALHNFYLGYFWRGIISIALLILGFALVGPALFGGVMPPLATVGLGILFGRLIWQLSDLVRIMTGSLQPRNGKYIP